MRAASTTTVEMPVVVHRQPTIRFLLVCGSMASGKKFPRRKRWQKYSTERV